MVYPFSERHAFTCLFFVCDDTNMMIAYENITKKRLFRDEFMRFLLHIRTKEDKLNVRN